MMWIWAQMCVQYILFQGILVHFKEFLNRVNNFNKLSITGFYQIKLRIGELHEVWSS